MSLQSTWSCLRPAASRRVLSAAATSRAAFSTTSSLSNIPPESPSYIRLPKVPQSTEGKPDRIRGTLPVPREIFDRRDGDRKVRPEYLTQTAPQRTTDRPLKSDAQRWKKQLADSRRKNLEEGLQGLWQRYETREKGRAARRDRAERTVRLAREAPEPRAAVMTRGTVLAAVADREG
ncbi:hypothetical protein ISF_00330 [Cordyceps fumosorosea ARSEF 2679]|uniref:Uncharacterized protein n=1 Tax=Cordyceps fumosorosea (strain ARSEF 2679) TaxID=1081104 RepID=A0A162N077_CORFA|nr:hypothetical protein ISF_00330 [Cordyceps fumosorosea ARSEF 2679]OAA73429.1 hypothetical protein ISF_00330 [Cordyceps fumosorosea ARSEF 2679]